MSDIPDPNLRLTLLHAVWRAGLLPRFDKPKFYREVLGEEYDPRADYNDEVDQRVRDALVAIPLPDDMLAKLTSVVWDGGLEPHFLIWPNWDGESAEFDVADLSGIQACTNVEKIEFTAGATFKDCSPLSGMPKLAKVLLRGDPLSDLSPLLTLPSLSRVNVSYERTPHNESVLNELRGRGVQVVDLRASRPSAS